MLNIKVNTWKWDPAETILFSPELITRCTGQVSATVYCKHTNWSLLQEGLGIETGSVRHQQLCHMHLKQQQQQQWKQFVLMVPETFVCAWGSYLFPVVFSLPDPSTLQHEEAAIHLNLWGPHEPPPPAAALQPARSHLLLRCVAATTEKGIDCFPPVLRIYCLHAKKIMWNSY